MVMALWRWWCWYFQVVIYLVGRARPRVGQSWTQSDFIEEGTFPKIHQHLSTGCSFMSAFQNHSFCIPLSEHLSRDFPNGDVFIHMDWHIWEQNLSLDTFCFATYLRNRIWAEFYNLCTLWLGWMCRSSPAVLVLTAHDGPFYPHLLQPSCFWPL